MSTVCHISCSNLIIFHRNPLTVGFVTVAEVDDVVHRRVDDLEQVVEAHQAVDPLKADQNNVAI